MTLLLWFLEVVILLSVLARSKNRQKYSDEKINDASIFFF